MGWLTEKEKRKKRRLDLLDGIMWFKDTVDYEKRVKAAGGIVDDIVCFNAMIWNLKYG